MQRRLIKQEILCRIQKHVFLKKKKILVQFSGFSVTVGKDQLRSFLPQKMKKMSLGCIHAAGQQIKALRILSGELFLKIFYFFVFF